MSKTAFIKTENLSIGYPGLLLAENISLECKAGELIGIAGLNGSGKSTFIKTLCRIQEPLGGRVLMREKDIRHQDLKETAKTVSVVLTERAGGFNLKAYDVVATGQMPYTNAFHSLKKEHHNVIAAAIKTCKLEDHQYKQVHELSDGLFQKTMIARALAQQTPVMLLDEPTAFLDYASKHELYLLLQELTGQQKKTILISSHDLDLMMRYCTRILVFHNRTVSSVLPFEAPQHPGFKEIAGGFL